MEAKKGTKVHIEYEGRFPDGEVFDSTEKHGGEALAFVAGEGMVVKGFDNAVIGMKVGEEKEVTVKPEKIEKTEKTKTKRRVTKIAPKKKAKKTTTKKKPKKTTTKKKTTAKKSTAKKKTKKTTKK